MGLHAWNSGTTNLVVRVLASAWRLCIDGYVHSMLAQVVYMQLVDGLAQSMLPLGSWLESSSGAAMQVTTAHLFRGLLRAQTAIASCQGILPQVRGACHWEQNIMHL
jgi:hypothetical protein